jgi:hypothetical protein
MYIPTGMSNIKVSFVVSAWGITEEKKKSRQFSLHDTKKILEKIQER